MTRARIMVLLLAAALLLVAGCSKDDPLRVNGGADDPWPDRTEKDHMIETLLRCYENPNLGVTMTKYEALLHSEYVFVLDASDVAPGEDPIITRDEDIEITSWIFENQIYLALTLARDGVWAEVTNEYGQALGWLTERAYSIRAEFAVPGYEGKVFQSPPDRARVTIVVARDENDFSKWVIRSMHDVISN